MPYGSGVLIRGALARANHWQRYLIATAMVAGGAALVAVGHLAGALLAGGGVLLLVRLVRHQTASSSRRGSTSTPVHREGSSTAAETRP